MIHLQRFVAGLMFAAIAFVIIAPGILANLTRDSSWFLLYIPHLVVLTYSIGHAILAKE